MRPRGGPGPGGGCIEPWIVEVGLAWSCAWVGSRVGGWGDSGLQPTDLCGRHGFGSSSSAPPTGFAFGGFRADRSGALRD